mgnify:CR=1 FL=1
MTATLVPPACFGQCLVRPRGGRESFHYHVLHGSGQQALDVMHQAAIRRRSARRAPTPQAPRPPG